MKLLRLRPLAAYSMIRNTSCSVEYPILSPKSSIPRSSVVFLPFYQLWSRLFGSFTFYFCDRVQFQKLYFFVWLWTHSYLNILILNTQQNEISFLSHFSKILMNFQWNYITSHIDIKVLLVFKMISNACLSDTVVN